MVAFMRPYIWSRRVVEPFCGWLNVTQHLQPAIANDGNKNIIDMFIQWRAGWRPQPITKEQYKEIIKIDSFERGFYGVACSFSGKWCDLFVGDKINNNGELYKYMQNYNSLTYKMNNLTNYTKFTSGQYYDVQLQYGDIVYCDPPYANTSTPYVGTFDSVLFWQWVMDNRNKALFFISEYTAPDYVPCVWSKDTRLRSNVKGYNDKNVKRVEKLFMIGVE